jgi:iron complex transport system substrate-binding protein
MRICSLLPGATEIVCALGLADQLVAVTHECDYPAEVRRLPVITRSAVGGRTHGSRAIDQHVSAAGHDGSSLYSLDHDLLATLAPDLVLTQELCGVCAISYTEVAPAVARLSGARTVLSLSPRTLEGILGTIVEVGEATGVAEHAVAFVQSLRDRIASVRTRASVARTQPRTFAMEWLDPPYTAGHWVPEMVRLAGGHDALGREAGFSETISWETIVSYDPEVVVFMPCSFDLERGAEELSDVSFPAEWADVAAVRAGRVAMVDSSAYFSRSGPRVVDGLEILAEIIHPELFPRRSAPSAWRLLDGRRLGQGEGRPRRTDRS